MTWQDPGGNTVPGGSDGGREASPPGGEGGPYPPPLPPSVPAGPPPAPGPALQGPGVPGDPSPGYAPGYTSPGYASPAYPAPGYAPPAMAWAPPDASYGDPTALRFADVAARFVAWLLDNLLLGLATSIVAWILFAAIAGDIDWQGFVETQAGVPAFDRATFERFALLSFASTVVGTAVNYVYFAFQWSSGARATLGMRFMRLQVGNAGDGRTLGLGQATRRWFAMGTWASLFSVVPVVGGLVWLVQIGWQLILLITTSSSPTKQGLHDRFAETAIVTQGRGDRVAAGCLLFIGILVVFTLISFIALLAVGAQVSSVLEDIGNSV